MITHLQEPDGTWRELSEEERRRVNQDRMGISREDQAVIEAIESGEVNGDVTVIEDPKRPPVAKKKTSLIH